MARPKKLIKGLKIWQERDEEYDDIDTFGQCIITEPSRNPDFIHEYIDSEGDSHRQKFWIQEGVSSHNVSWDPNHNRTYLIAKCPISDNLMEMWIEKDKSTIGWNYCHMEANALYKKWLADKTLLEAAIDG